MLNYSVSGPNIFKIAAIFATIQTFKWKFLILFRWQPFLFIALLKKVLWADTFTSPILGPLPLFWISGDVSFRFQIQSGICLNCIAEANIIYIPWDPPLVLHIANLLTVNIVGWWCKMDLPYLHCRGKYNIHSLRSTSGATHCQPLDSCGLVM